MTIRTQELYTFFVVARAGAMHLAADELGVTPGAISQRIRAIEETHGRRLFSRHRSGVSLTTAGQELWKEVSDAFSVLETTHRRHFANARRSQIRISTSPTFAHAFLVSALGEFTSAHPKICLDIESDYRLVDLKTEPVDLAIRHGLGTYPGLVTKWLCAPELILVGSPALIEDRGPITRPEDCLRFPLLPDETGTDWNMWFKAHGVDAKHARYTTTFRVGYLTVKAAVNSQGLALLSDVYVREELSTGHLVRAFDGSWPTKFAYYAAGLPETFERPPVKAFINWLQPSLAAV